VWIAAAAAIVAIFAGLLALRAPRSSVSTTTITTTTIAAPVETAIEAPIRSLRDAGRTIALFNGGRIEGIDVTEDEAELLRDALTNGTIELPDAVQALTPVAPTMRAGDLRARFNVLAPLGTLVLDARPQFAWTALPDARSYSVTVFYRDFRQVAESGALTATHWRPTQSLPRDATLMWQVAAQTADGETIAPDPLTGEAQFRIASESTARRIRDAERRRRDSHLMLGLIYARHGLRAEAKRELTRVVQDNPGSLLAKKLLASAADLRRPPPRALRGSPTRESS
jgi:hypothetical protein